MPEESQNEYYGLFEKCSLCPRKCLVNRLKGEKGYCKAGTGYEIASVSVHKGEEPVISGEKGICNIFFYHCNLQCVFCQNYQISQKGCSSWIRILEPEELLESIKNILDTGIENLGFVSPSHMIPQMISIIKSLEQDGYNPFIIYNTNGYDSIETLRLIEEFVDVYLPDFKYSDRDLAFRYSDAANYPEIAGQAIKEMYRQKGNILHINENGIAEKGLIIRQLVLPGEVENSKAVLRYIAEEISNRISLSLMSQYNPVPLVEGNEQLNRKIRSEEYIEVVEEMERLGFYKGCIQEAESSDFLMPDFNKELPFESN